MGWWRQKWSDGEGFATYGVLHAVAAAVVLLLGLVLLPAAGGRPAAAGSTSALSGYAGILRRRPVLLLGVLRFVPTCYYGTAALLMPLLIYRAAGTASSAALYGTASLVFASLCQLAAGRLCDRVSRTRFVAMVTVLMSVTAVATAWAVTSLVALYICGLLAAGLAWALAVAVPGLVNDVASAEEQGRTLAVTHVSWYCGMVLGTQAAGLLVGLGSGPPFLVAGVFNLLAVAASVLLGRDVGWGRSRPRAVAAELGGPTD